MLFEAAIQWLKQWKVDSIIGPTNFSFNEICGLLVEGFDFRPVIMMAYNPPYCSKLIKDAGFLKKTDL